jgi:histidine triad (HIT) family protein
MEDCIFCKIANGQIPSEIIYDDELITAFKDTSPQAPVHFLVVPKKHIESLDTVTDEDAKILSWIMLKIKDITKSQGIENGYRVINNCGEDGQQTVKHLHFHVLGKRKMTWPPG